MFTVGIDVHLRSSAVCILDENGRRIKRFLHRGDPRTLVPLRRQVSKAASPSRGNVENPRTHGVNPQRFLKRQTHQGA